VLSGYLKMKFVRLRAVAVARTRVD